MLLLGIVFLFVLIIVLSTTQFLFSYRLIEQLKTVMQPEFMAKYEAVLSRNYVSCLLEGSFQEVNTLQDQMRDNASTIDDAANAIIDCNKELKKKDEKISAEVWCLLINRL